MARIYVWGKRVCHPNFFGVRSTFVDLLVSLRMARCDHEGMVMEEKREGKRLTSEEES